MSDLKSDLTLYELAPSPNSIKVRLALGLKGIPCERVAVSPRDRERVVRLTGQPLTPVLKDRDRVVYDSYAILRYLDANWPAEPRLYAAERAVQQEIETWELFGRVALGEVIGMVFGQLFAPEADPAVLERANALLAERTVRLEDTLAGKDYLTGAAPNAADLTVAPFAYYGLLDPAAHPDGSPQAFFARHLHLPEDLVRTRAWVARVMAHDLA